MATATLSTGVTADSSWFETLSEDEVLELLRRRFRRFVERGIDVGEALLLATRLDVPAA
jgi:hypothetical protein